MLGQLLFKTTERRDKWMHQLIDTIRERNFDFFLFVSFVTHPASTPTVTSSSPLYHFFYQPLTETLTETLIHWCITFITPFCIAVRYSLIDVSLLSLHLVYRHSLIDVSLLSLHLVYRHSLIDVSLLSLHLVYRHSLIDVSLLSLHPVYRHLLMYHFYHSIRYTDTH